MVSLAPSQSSRLVSCFALTQSVSLDLGPSKLEQTFVVSAQVFKTTGTASFTGVSRKSCTRSTFHLLPYSEFALHMCFRSERPSVGCSGSELRSDKDQNSAIKNTSGHRSASSLSYKQGSVSLLGGCSTPNIPNIIAFSPPSCATVLHPDNEVLLSFATHTLVYKLRPDVLRSSSASHPPARLVVNGPNFNCLWAWPSTTKEGSGPLLSQSIPTAYESQLTTGLIILTSLKNSEGFLGIYIMSLLLYHSYRMNCSVDSPTLLPVLSFSSTRERILLPCLFSVKGDDSSGLIPRVCFNLLTGLPPCVAVCTGPEGAIETTSVSLVGEGWLSTSQHKVVFFTNSGTEANELAMMMARLYTGCNDVVSLRNSYHGNAAATMGATAQSNWKFNVVQSGVHHAINPDPYRGIFGSDGEKYARDVHDLIQFGTSGQVAGFIGESIQGVGGIVELAPGYLRAAYDIVRRAGGVCIADEVQSGFARTGTHFWGFQSHGVIPDIVTMAKGIGNGIPLGAVVTTPEIAGVLSRRFYFNTFGGNPMCTAAGHAVLRVIREEKLQENALLVGSHLTRKLTQLKDKYELIGDVRGRGLMLGVEFVTDRDLKTPAKSETLHLMDQMKEMGVLVGKGGFYGNVFRITPPLCFTLPDADFLVDVMDHALSKM